MYLENCIQKSISDGHERQAGGKACMEGRMIITRHPRKTNNKQLFEKLQAMPHQVENAPELAQRVANILRKPRNAMRETGESGV